MARPHAVVVPYPGSGNINPALQLAKLLHHSGVYVTFVNTEHNHRRVHATEGAAGLRGREGFRFETIPDGLGYADQNAKDYKLSRSVSGQHCAAPLRDLVARLNGAAGVPPVTCLVPTTLMSFVLDVARELGLPSMVLWACSAAALMTHMRLRDLREMGYLPLQDESYLTNGHLETTVIDWIPGMPPISLGDISGFVRTTDPDEFGLRFNEVEANGCTKADALILNTMNDLEADVLAALRNEFPRIYTIGPLGSHLRHSLAADSAAAGGLSLWQEDDECLPWLDKKEPGSVVYANFGSVILLTPEQLAEFAWGLADSGHPFLLCIREGLVPGGGLDALPPEFVAETASRCHVTTWCAQEQVLRHPAVGCFLTHNGVPMVCWPRFADQYTNCKYVSELWDAGLRLDEKVRREQVAGHVRQVIETEGMRRSAARWKAKAEEAVSPGGPSWENLQGVVRVLNSQSVRVD